MCPPRSPPHEAPHRGLTGYNAWHTVVKPSIGNSWEHLTINHVYYTGSKENGHNTLHVRYRAADNSRPTLLMAFSGSHSLKHQPISTLSMSLKPTDIYLPFNSKVMVNSKKRDLIENIVESP